MFVGSKVVSTAHLGDVMFRGCERLETLPANVVSLSSGPDGAVVSLLEKGRWNYLVIVSRTLDRPTDITVEFDRKTWMIDHEGKAVKVAKGEVAHSLEAGDAIIFKYKKIN